jgi:hypothetical protein
MSIGYAIIEKDGYLDVRTVSPTERAVKVNALVVIFKSMVSSTATDEQINDRFDYHNHRRGCRVAKVSIEEVRDE